MDWTILIFLKVHNSSKIKTSICISKSFRCQKYYWSNIVRCKNASWEVIYRPPDLPGSEFLDSIWVFEIKRDSKNKIKGYKARLCVNGCKQKLWVNNEDTYTSMVRYESLRSLRYMILLALDAQLDLQLVQFVVKTACLYGDKPIYIKIPHGLEVNGIKKSKVWRLKKAVYRIKQDAGMRFSWVFENVWFCAMWIRNFSVYILNKRRNSDFSYLRRRWHDIFAHCIEHENKVISALKKIFKIIIGEADMFVCIQITRDRENKSIFLHQEAYANRVLEKLNVLDAPCDIPADSNTALCVPKQNIDVNVPYTEVIGSLMFLSVVTHPDLAYIVNILSRYMYVHIILTEATTKLYSVCLNI